MPITVEVQNGEIISMNAADGTSHHRRLIQAMRLSPDMQRLTASFPTLEAGLAGDADEVTVTYDPTYGFPTEIYFDYIKAAADDELSLSVSDFEALNLRPNIFRSLSQKRKTH